MPTSREIHVMALLPSESYWISCLDLHNFSTKACTCIKKGPNQAMHMLSSRHIAVLWYTEIWTTLMFWILRWRFESQTKIEASNEDNFILALWTLFEYLTIMSTVSHSLWNLLVQSVWRHASMITLWCSELYRDSQMKSDFSLRQHHNASQAWHLYTVRTYALHFACMISL